MSLNYSLPHHKIRLWTRCSYYSWFLKMYFFICRNLGPLAAMEFVQCELWRGGEGKSTWMFAALRCWRDAVHWHGEGTVQLLPRELCWSVSCIKIPPIFLKFFFCLLFFCRESLLMLCNCFPIILSVACTISIPTRCTCWICTTWYQYGCGGRYFPLPGCNSVHRCGDCVEKVLPDSSVQLCPQRLRAFPWGTQTLWWSLHLWPQPPETQPVWWPWYTSGIWCEFSPGSYSCPGQSSFVTSCNTRLTGRRKAVSHRSEDVANSIWVC